MARDNVHVCVGVPVPPAWAGRVERGARRDPRAGRAHALPDAAAGDRSRGARESERQEQREGQVLAEDVQKGLRREELPDHADAVRGTDLCTRDAVPPGVGPECPLVG